MANPSEIMNTFEGRAVMDLHPLNGGMQLSVMFPNGWGASVIRHSFSYGGDEGLFELAVINKHGRLDYDNPLTNDVLGWLSVPEVVEHLHTIASWEAIVTEGKRLAGKQEGTTRVIESLSRLRNSVNGNPRYRITFTDGSSAVTSSDRSFAYEMGNPGMREGSTVSVEFTRAGRISHMQPVKDWGVFDGDPDLSAQCAEFLGKNHGKGE